LITWYDKNEFTACVSCTGIIVDTYVSYMYVYQYYTPVKCEIW